MLDVVESLKKSQNELLKKEGEDLDLLKNMQHTAKDLRKLLKVAILDIEIQNGKRYVCTANVELVKKFSPIRSPENSMKKSKQSPFDIEDKNRNLAWDILHGKYITIVGNRWTIFNFLAIREENVDLLHSLLLDILRKPI